MDDGECTDGLLEDRVRGTGTVLWGTNGMRYRTLLVVGGTKGPEESVRASHLCPSHFASHPLSPSLPRIYNLCLVVIPRASMITYQYQMGNSSSFYDSNKTTLKNLGLIFTRKLDFFSTFFLYAFLY